MGKFFDRFHPKQKDNKQEIKNLEEQKKVTQLLITWGKSPEWQEVLKIFTEDKESLLLMQGNAMENGKDKLAAIIYGQVKQCNRFLNLVKDCEENLNLLENELKLNEEVKNG